MYNITGSGKEFKLAGIEDFFQKVPLLQMPKRVYSIYNNTGFFVTPSSLILFNPKVKKFIWGHFWKNSI